MIRLVATTLVSVLLSLGLAQAATAQSPAYGPSVVSPSIAAAVDEANRGNYAAAIQMLQPLAAHGDINAQIRLARFYADGQGVPKDRVTGEMWCLVALSRIGSVEPSRSDTQTGCTYVKMGLTPAQLADARDKAQTWRPAPPDGAHVYMIFFDFEIPNMTEKATEVADMATLTAINTHAAHIEIVGHSDTLEKLQTDLSLARANVVRQYLLQKGVLDATQITVRGAGPYELMVATPPGTREPMDRYVTVVEY